MMTLDQVRDALKGVWVPTHWGTDGRSYKMSDLIESLDHYLSQPQPVAQGEAVDARKLAVDRYTSGEEQRAFVDGYAAATTTIPAGHRVVPEVDEHGLAFVDGIGWVVQCPRAVEYVNILRSAAPDAGGV